jgi:hypothetical protein
MFQKSRYFLLVLGLAAAGCADRGEEEDVEVVPVGPGTRPTAITPPDTPGSLPPYDTTADSAATPPAATSTRP